MVKHIHNRNRCQVCHERTTQYNGLCEDHTPPAFNKKCPICLDSILEKNKVQFECGHKVHWECLSKLNSAQCPLCRKNLEYLPPSLLGYINNK